LYTSLRYLDEDQILLALDISLRYLAEDQILLALAVKI
jgi:hypothetical protein